MSRWRQETSPPAGLRTFIELIGIDYLTTIVPVIAFPCTMQLYWYVPAELNVNE